MFLALLGRKRKSSGARGRSLLGQARSRAYLSAVWTLVNVVFNFEPRPCTTAMMATEIPAAIRPYSMAVAPDSSFTKRETRFFIRSSLRFHTNPSGYAWPLSGRAATIPTASCVGVNSNCKFLICRSGFFAWLTTTYVRLKIPRHGPRARLCCEFVHQLAGNSRYVSADLACVL